MKEPSRWKYGRPVLWFASVLLIFLVSVDTIIVSHQRGLLMDIRQNDVRNELNIMGSFVREALLKRDYGTVENFLVQWGKDHQDVLEIKAVTPNNFVLAEYRSPLPREHFYRAQQDVSHEGEHLITLEFIKDFSIIENSMNKLSLRLVAGSVLFIAVFGFLLWHTVNITAMKPLESEIAERKKAEEALNRSKEELQSTNEELKSFAYIISHDLRAPLVNIKGFSEEFKRTMEEGRAFLAKLVPLMSEEDRKTYAEIFERDLVEEVGFIGASVRRMEALINSVLKLSRLGRIVLNLSPVRTEELVNTLLKSLEHQIEMHRAEVSVGPLPDIVADRTVVEQIFGNVLDNAIKYLEPSRPGKIEVTAEGTPGETVFLIRDNGSGIAKQDIPKIFELFRRVSKKNVPGEGVGLAYVKTLVKRLGGRIWCESEPGAGSTFGFTIPCRAPEEANVANDGERSER